MTSLQMAYQVWDEIDWSVLNPLLETADLLHITAGIQREEREADTHFLTATLDGAVVGLLLFLVQPIGPEMDIPIVRDEAGRPLTEAKIRAFYVLPDQRKRGIGTGLQELVLDKAAELGCYQVRSRSELDKEANYAIKLKLGFAMHPALRVYDEESSSAGVYWVKCVAI